MRTAFANTLLELAKSDPRIVLMVGDLGFGVVTEFMQQLPNQFVNVGVAEQNMTGMAAGMALSGKIVFTYSIANFPVLRCYEQIRNDICYHNAAVIVVSVGGGMAYGSLGPSHHATEDIAVMRSLPNMMVVAPGDPVETKLAIHALVARQAPAYLRIGRAGEPVVHQTQPDFRLGKSITIRSGKDVTLLSTGGMLYNTLQAAALLEQQGIQATVLSMHTVKPLDTEALLQAATQTSALFTIEEHSILGGLGGSVAELLLESGHRPQYFKRIGLNGDFSSLVGSQEYLCAQYGLDAKGIAQTVLQTLENKKRI